jgi:DNA-binding response OmpR family regulator
MRVPRFGSLPDDVPWAVAARAAQGPGPGRASRVLLVERDAMLGFALTSVLEGHYDVELARDAAQALRCLATAHFDAILADDAPGSGGQELLREVRRRHPRVRRLLMTRDDPSAVTGEDGLWEGVLAKPFELDDLLELLRGIEPVPSSRSAAIC